MHSKEYLEILKQGADVWNKWRNENQYTRPDLTYVHLRGANLADANLADSDLADADLREANLHRANLSHADLSEANLNNANLHDANLADANLSDAELVEVELLGADLSRANLSGAGLEGADLSFASLWAADLDCADLSFANLHRTDLGKANLHGAWLEETNFIDVDLGTTQNLEHCNHHGPCTIDHRTLTKSGRLPEIFLRGCGLSDEFINHIPSLFWSPKALEFYSCFISYSHADQSFARRLHDTLQGRGIRCWLDEKQILPGDVLYDQIDRGIKLWDKVLLCCSENSLEKSWWVDKEIDKALNKEREILKQRSDKVLALIPLNLDNYLFSDKWTSGKKSIVLERLAADFTDWEKDNAKFESEFEKVVKALRADAGGRENPPSPKL